MIRQSDSTREQPVRLARRAIDALEQRILDEFGMRVTLGAEQEFTVQTYDTTHPNGMLISNPLKLPDGGVRGDYTPQAQRDDKDRLFPDSPYVAYSYKERPINYKDDDEEYDVAPIPYFQYETVLSHEAFKREKSDGQPRLCGNHLARSIEGLRNVLKAGPDGLPSTEPFSHAEDLHEIVKGVHLWPTVCGNAITNGLHINAGLQDAQTNASALAHDDALMAPIRHAIDDMNSEGAYLLGNERGTLARHELREDYFTTEIPHGKPYIANQAAAANANPYYAILNTMAGLYVGLKRYHEHNPSLYQRSNSRSPTEKAFSTHGSILNQGALSAHYLRAPDNGLRRVLNDVAPALGDQLVEAIERTPPGEELLPVEGRSNGRSH